MKPVAFSYIRFSTPEQRKGDSLRRQTEAAAAWCSRNNVRLDESTTLHDLGKSAYLGEHRKNPDRHALAAFLKLVEGNRVPRGSYLIIESLDRLTREHVRAGLMLLLGLIEAGVRIVQLSPSELVYDERSDEMGLMLAIVELSRGHRESKRKSDLSGPAWRRKKAAAKEGVIVTDRLPAWVKAEGGKLVLIPERAKLVKRIFKMAGSGYGTPSIVAKLNREGVPAIGKTGRWVKGYVGKILRDRRAVGEYQPRTGKKRVPDGEPVKGYFPAVVTEEEFFAARAGAAERGTLRGRLGTQAINVFAGLVKSAREGDGYYMTQRVERGQKHYVMVTSNSQSGSPCWSFPYPAFERSILALLKEVDPREIVVKDRGGNAVMELSGELGTVEGKIAELEAELLAGDVPSLTRVLRTLEERKATIAAKLAEARAKAAHPLAEAWGEYGSLLAALDSAPDPEDARLRMRSALRRIVDDIWLLVVPRKMTRLAAVQIHFKGDGRREYLIYYRPPHHSFAGRKEGRTLAASLMNFGADKAIDLRDPEQAAELAALLTEADLGELETTLEKLTRRRVGG
ncbi:MAG: recombinase family protein [Planctomycetia bacterium]|nr:recombinase family protein [Planctomycetia bacterium]